MALRTSSQTFELKNNVLIATHHKTGTVWLASVFGSICNLYSVSFNREFPEKTADGFAVYLQDHSQFDFESVPVPFRGVHMIRDPRDVIVSGCFYHQQSGEKWLHRAREEYGGMTYQEKINSFESFDDKLIFEMENCASWTIQEMIKWDYGNENFYEIKYESLIEDIDLVLFHQIFSFLKFPGELMPMFLNIAYKKSLFSGFKNNMHVRSGKSRQWKEYFKSAHKKKFIELFGDLLVQLDYETDNSWIDG